MKFVRPLDEITEQQLKIIENSGCESSRTRNRAEAVRLSSKGFKIDDIATVCDVCRLTVSTWIDNRDEYSFQSPVEAPGRGRKPLVDPSEYEQVLEIVREEPGQPKRALAQIKEKMNKSVSIDTLKRILKKTGFPGTVSENL